MDDDLLQKLSNGLIDKHQAKLEQEKRNLHKEGKYETCNVIGIEQTPTEIVLEKTRIRYKKLKVNLMEKEKECEQLQKEKDYWKKLANLQISDKFILLLNTLEENICKSCKVKDENSDDWCPYGCYTHNSFRTNLLELNNSN